ncbi:hypothetical protein IQ246_15520 [aff. Roholtiella sp. LEGE 12411]|nr:hypothetical protein [aff. Roholtiella sp. LEGE 12411]
MWHGGWGMGKKLPMPYTCLREAAPTAYLGSCSIEGFVLRSRRSKSRCSSARVAQYKCHSPKAAGRLSLSTHEGMEFSVAFNKSNYLLPKYLSQIFSLIMC